MKLQKLEISNKMERPKRAGLFEAYHHLYLICRLETFDKSERERAEGTEGRSKRRKE